ncbi:MAG: hypothetical protein HY289_06870 [Planctomycetes bacterium]|nr:hypothetical protein [Planctomycetota bacterium]
MIILDENIPRDQWEELRRKRVPVKKIGVDIGRSGTKDDRLIPLLHRLSRPTFFTLDADFWDRSLRHEGYCLVYLDVERNTVAVYVRRILRHSALNTKAKRMGTVIRAEPEGISLWRVRHESEEYLSWE